MSRGSTYGISRVDNETSRTHGWLVTIQRRGVIYRKHFSDGVFGGKQRSFAAAKEYRDEVIAAHPPLSMQEYSNIVKKNNRSGVVGVCRYCASETRDLPEEKQRWFWVASWPLPDGRRKRVKFSVKKYGEDGAFQMAMDASTWSASVVLMNRSNEMPSFSCMAWKASEFLRASSEVGMPSAAAVCAILRPCSSVPVRNLTS